MGLVYFITYELPPVAGGVGPCDVGAVEGDVVGPAGAVVVGFWTGVVVTGPGFFGGSTEGRPVPLPPSVPVIRLGAVAAMPAGTWVCAGVVLADTLRLAEPAGAVAAGLTGELSLVVLIG